MACHSVLVPVARLFFRAHATSDVTQTTREQPQWLPQIHRGRLQSEARKYRSSASSAADGGPTHVCLVSRCNVSSRRRGEWVSRGSHE